ncbi:metal ABC transporter substrate-binding protein [Haloterrigena alkaliphila]|uniref:Zinc ABC transporter substrate-binding protein n=1 Tax=Haloterrigena alkaliphila TaxID=2816475 RepID=A0A8A2VKC8_9EURY|nr:metal ABC transporter substrate-binding protein [Haloterrigena alkaliphila]QSW98668.1 metal ABC transporter substrate-binding protein [Haloterrigena alkaliphila]
MNRTRRSLLGSGAGLLAATTFAGCLDDVGLAEREYDSGYAALFALYDWADQISGDVIDVENPVGTGESGHGWNPRGDLTRDVADAGLFVYLDTPEFGWAQDIATTLEADYNDVVVVDGFAGLDDQLLEWDHEGGGHDHGGEDESGGHDHGDEGGDHDHEDGQEDHNHEDEQGHDHDRTGVDPHAWLDPVLAQDIVANIVDGLAEAHPDEESTFRDRADEYAGVLEEIDAQFEQLVDEADRDTAVLVSHDSFTYLEERYGFELHTPVGVSPNEGMSQNAISETITYIDDEGIDTILYDAFDAPGGEYPDEVATILDGSDATNAMPLATASGTLASWAEKDWGYREQMEAINIPAFRNALDAQ